MSSFVPSFINVTLCLFIQACGQINISITVVFFTGAYALVRPANILIYEWVLRKIDIIHKGQYSYM